MQDQALLHVFAFDQLYSQLTGRGSAINLSGFFSVQCFSQMKARYSLKTTGITGNRTEYRPCDI